jgi:hypothetical protein
VQLVSQDLGHRSGMLNKIVDKIEAALARNRA